MRRASRANSSSGWPSAAVGRRGRCGRPRRCRRSGPRSGAALKPRAAATSSMSASMSELRNSEERVAALADQVEVARVAVGVLEAEAALAEVDLAGDAGLDHPLQRAVDGGAADARVLAADDLDEIVRADVPVLPQEDVDDEVALAGSLAARRAAGCRRRPKWTAWTNGPAVPGRPRTETRPEPGLGAERRTAAAGGLGVRVADGEAAARPGCRRNRLRRPSGSAR